MMIMDDVIDDIEDLIRTLGYESVRKRAVKELVRIGEPAVLPLIDALKAGNPNLTRQGAAMALGEIRDVRAIEPLVEVLMKDELSIREAAVDAVAKIGEPAVRRLIKALKDGDEYTRYWVAGALVDIGAPAVGPLVEESRKAGNEHLRREISKILEKIDYEAKEKQHDFGVREKSVIRAPKIPDEFQKLMLDKTVKVKVSI